MKPLVHEVVSDKKQVKIVNDGTLELMTMRNGRQWTGMPVDDEMLKAIHKAITAYFKIPKQQEYVKDAVIAEYEDHIEPPKGKCIFIAPHTPLYDVGENYKSDVVTNPSWDDIVKLANDMINKTGDFHHIFLEDVAIVKVIPQWVGEVPKGVKVFKFIMGS